MLIINKPARLDTKKLTPKQRYDSLIERNSGKSILHSDHSIGGDNTAYSEGWDRVFGKKNIKNESTRDIHSY